MSCRKALMILRALKINDGPEELDGDKGNGI